MQQSAMFAGGRPQARGTFSSAYALPKDAKKLRLMDVHLTTAQQGQAGYLDPVRQGNFCVLDTATMEKAWFEWPQSLDVEAVQAKIEGHFGARASRVGASFWIV